MTSPDPGLFGPDSVTWRIHSDPTMGVAGLRALLLQALHPRAMAGVHQHSTFRSDPWGRLFRTAEFVGVLTYGTVAEAERIAARVRGIHRRLRAVDPRTGEDYPIDDPALLLWVHCSEVDSYLSVARRAGAPITAADADAYVAEQVVAARLVGVAGAVPSSVAELAAYFAARRPELALTREAYEAAKFVLAPPMPGWVRVATPATPAWFSLATTAMASLPRWARRMYALPGLPVTDVAVTAGLVGMRVALSALPERARLGPQHRAALARLAASTGDDHAVAAQSPDRSWAANA